MRVTELQYGKLQSSIFKLGKALGESGGEVITRIDDDEEFRMRVAQFMACGAPNPIGSSPLTYRVAKAIMGEDKAIGPDQIQRHLGLPVEPEWFAAAETVPFLPETLTRYRETHLLVFGCEVTLDMCFKQGPLWLQWKLHDSDAAEMRATSPEPGWFLVGRQPTPLNEGERLATVVEVYLALTVHKKLNNRPFFFNMAGLCLTAIPGPEVLFGRGLFTDDPNGSRHAYGVDYSYNWKVKNGENRKITVVLPDNAPQSSLQK